MDKNEIANFIGRNDLPLSKAMQAIDKNSNGILFLVDENDKLAGCITDGDIRRFLLAGGKITDQVSNAANLTPLIAHSVDEAKTLYHKKNYVVIPIVDENKNIIDLYNGVGNEKKRGALHVPVVINAGGRGTRLDPFTRVLPKPLIPVGELPIIELIMQEYQSYQCDEFHIIVNYKKELMKAYFNDNENHYNINWYDETVPLGTGGGLSLLKGKINDTFFFANCDALLTANYESMLAFHKENKNVITIICAYKNISIPYGVIEMGVNGSIEEMKEKPELSFLTNTGIYIVEPEVIEEMEDNVSIGFPDVVELQKSLGKKVAVYPISENEWMDMGQLPELERMRKRLYGEGQ